MTSYLDIINEFSSVKLSPAFLSKTRFKLLWEISVLTYIETPFILTPQPCTPLKVLW